MGSILNFIYSDSKKINGYESSNDYCRFTRGPLNQFIQKSSKISNTIDYEILPDYKNFFLIELDHIEKILKTNVFDSIPLSFLEKISNNSVTLLIVSIGETSDFSNNVFDNLEKLLLTYNIDASNVHLIDSNFDVCKYDSKFKRYNSLHYLLTDNLSDAGMNELNYISEVPTIDKAKTHKIRTKHFLSLNRQNKPHRYLLLHHVHNNKLYDKFYISYLTTASSFGIDNDYDFSKFENDINKTIPIELDTHTCDDKGGFFPGNTMSHHYLDSYFNIVTETFFSKPISTFTEKIVKPIIGLQPFIVISTPYYLRNLKSLGFKTFDSIWDESYDLIENDDSRIGKIFNLIDEISSWDIEYCDKVYKSVLDICIYNRNHLYNLYDDGEFEKILNKIVNEC